MTAWGGDCPLRPTPIPLSRPSPLPGMAVRKGTTYRQWDNNMNLVKPATPEALNRLLAGVAVPTRKKAV